MFIDLRRNDVYIVSDSLADPDAEETKTTYSPGSAVTTPGGVGRSMSTDHTSSTSDPIPPVGNCDRKIARFIFPKESWFSFRKQIAREIASDLFTLHLNSITAELWLFTSASPTGTRSSGSAWLRRSGVPAGRAAG